MKKLLAALLALLCLPVMTALGDTQGDFTYALTPEGAVVTITVLSGSASAAQTLSVSSRSVRAPVGQTLMH